MKECTSGSCCPSTKKECCCQDKSYNKYGGQSDFFLEIADCAWLEVLKEKIKEHIKTNDSEYLNKLAKLIAEGNQKRWEHKMSGEKCCHDFEQKLCALLSCTEECSAEEKKCSEK